MKIIGIVPARMASSRFPGKPLHPILGHTLVEHCFLRARFFGRWDGLFLATCDEEIREFGESRGIPVLMPADTHTRALDRVAEGAAKCGIDIAEDDVVINVQADEPLLGPDVIEAVIKPFDEDPSVDGTMLAVPIVDEGLHRYVRWAWALGLDEGATLIFGGEPYRPAQAMAGASRQALWPTVFSNVEPHQRFARLRRPAPILALLRVRSDREGTRLAAELDGID